MQKKSQAHNKQFNRNTRESLKDFEKAVETLAI